MEIARRRDVVLWFTLVSAAALGAAGVSCSGGSSGESSAAQGTGGAGPGGSGGSAGDGGGADGEGGTFIGSGPNPDGPFADFPARPQIDMGVPAEAPGLFEETPAQPQDGPCMAEPPMGVLVPTNWTPLRFEWIAPAGQNVFELRLSVENQVNELVVYTTATSYTIPEDVWTGLAGHSAGRDIKVVVRSAQIDGGQLVSGPFVGTEGVVHVAPVAAPGSIIYWTTGAPGSNKTALKGFTIGDTEVRTALAPEGFGDGTTCVGCHSSSPDGSFSFFVRDASNGARSVTARKVDGTVGLPTAMQVSTVALDLLARPKQVVPTLSEAHYSAQDAVVLTILYDPALIGPASEILWTDLHAQDPATGWGILERLGDTGAVASPTWWHDGTTIAYTSAVTSAEGVVTQITDVDQRTDIYTVPYNDRQGGDATPLPGASDPAYLEYYPVISPGDALLAFNRFAPYKLPNGQWADSYDEPMAEIFVVPAKGGEAARVAANDPPACVGKTSPGLTNSWPRWAPSAEAFDGKKYYWLTFSSKRRDANNPQLFVSGVVTRTENGAEMIDKTYPALYVTSQVPEENNHTPAWDVFQIEPPR
ncbi:TolB family protein [Sorangium sp. So ce233]|uniref:TolB family protein n=1 Tax=Sorangium sp. So ce233 TaxID=3133290 RepID=UPI003F623D24